MKRIYKRVSPRTYEKFRIFLDALCSVGGADYGEEISVDRGKIFFYTVGVGTELKPIRVAYFCKDSGKCFLLKEVL